MLVSSRITDITPTCLTRQSACTSPGSSYVTHPYGWEEHYYEKIIQLEACSDWLFFYNDCCRNYMPGNIQNYSPSFFIYTRLNTLDAPCNNTPSYALPPIIVGCINQLFCFSPGLMEADGDRLEVGFTSCREDTSTSVVYTNICPGGCSGSNPLPAATPPTIDLEDGTICLWPNTISAGVVCLLIREYRGSTLIGEYLRDMQVVLLACSGTPPQSSAINGTLPTIPYDPTSPPTYTAYFCPGLPQCFTLEFEDPEAEPVSVSYAGLPAGASFVVSHNYTLSPTAQFCWTPATEGKYTFYVTLQDTTCILRNTKTYRFIVVVTNHPPTFSSCGTTLLPLPDKDYLTVKEGIRSVGEAALLLWSLPEEERPKIALFDAAGHVLYNVQAEASKGSMEIPSPSAAGMYFLQVRTRTGLQTLRLVWQ